MEERKRTNAITIREGRREWNKKYEDLQMQCKVRLILPLCYLFNDTDSILGFVVLSARMISK